MNARALARARRLSPEAAAREARYRFLAELALREGFAAVATAHHAGDQLETLLIQMERSGRAESRAGMRRVARIAGVEVVRPLLGAQPAALTACAESRRLPFREDSTNLDPRLTRNRIRALATSRVDSASARLLLRLGSLQGRLVEALAPRVERLWSEPDGSCVRLPRDLLLEIPGPLRREVLRHAFHRVAPAAEALPERALDGVERLLRNPDGGDLDLRAARARVSCGRLLLEGRPCESPSGRQPPQTGAPRFAGGSYVERFDPEGVHGTVQLRSWEPGDRIEIRLAPAATGRDSAGQPELPLGHKKVKEVLREARVPRWERAGHPVVADGAGVLWVVGVRRGARAMPRPGAQVLRVEVGFAPAEHSGCATLCCVLEPAPEPEGTLA